MQIEENALSAETFEERLLGSLLPLANDPVPNIRLNVAKLLSHLLVNHGECFFFGGRHTPSISDFDGLCSFPEYFVTRPVHAQIVQIVEELRTDSDRDVRFMAEAARLEEEEEQQQHEEVESKEAAETEEEEEEQQLSNGPSEATSELTPPADDLW